ncbi:MAG: AbrB/MazE/SpoVT family DNA-binding domain-containing protein [Calditrichaeota bacterium]|nr:AbrB/MazE/SpoVT family DNA-binding domain-containing protein [Calditrichota bacterium]MCB9068760.1 AbrB/MazE/SpoVT family DNA-binding domain-containing protein [Calditrichia bacterium]
MVTVTVSSKYQIVIPQAIRNVLDIQVGQKIQLIPYQNRIEIVPLVDVKKMRGFLKGIDTTVNRESDRI